MITQTQKTTILWTVFFLGILILPTPTSTDKVALPYPWKIETPDKSAVFVMIPENKYLSKHLGEDHPHLKRYRSIREKYPESGLYPAGKTTPIYTVDWYAYEVNLSSDGTYLIRPGPPLPRSTDDLAVAFYKNGTLLEDYPVGDLIIAPLPWHLTVSHDWKKDETYDPSEQIYRIKTKHGGVFEFDIKTGEMVSSWRPDIVIFVALLIVIAIVAYKIARKIIRHWSTAEPPSD